MGPGELLGQADRMLGSLPSRPGLEAIDRATSCFGTGMNIGSTPPVYAKIYYPFITYKIQCKRNLTFRPQTKDLNGFSSVLRVQPVVTADCFFSLDSLDFRTRFSWHLRYRSEGDWAQNRWRSKTHANSKLQGNTTGVKKLMLLFADEQFSCSKIKHRDKLHFKSVKTYISA